MSMKRKLSLGLIFSMLLIAMNLNVVSAATSATVASNATVDSMIVLSCGTPTVTFSGNLNPSSQPSQTAANAISLTVNSNVQYHITAYASNDLTATGGKVIPISQLQVKQNSSGTWINLTKVQASAVEVVPATPATASTAHPIDFKLTIDWTAQPGNYSTDVIFAASQI